jgi:hypothetical protein
MWIVPERVCVEDLDLQRALRSRFDVLLELLHRDRRRMVGREVAGDAQLLLRMCRTGGEARHQEAASQQRAALPSRVLHRELLALDCQRVCEIELSSLHTKHQLLWMQSARCFPAFAARLASWAALEP